jgi:hypothetical protein
MPTEFERTAEIKRRNITICSRMLPVEKNGPGGARIWRYFFFLPFSQKKTPQPTITARRKITFAELWSRMGFGSW